jgi:hypothetical protein
MTTVIIALWMAGIEARLVFLQVVEHGDLVARATRQQMSRSNAAAKRGDILDRRGQVLATSVSADSFTDYANMGASFTLANGVLESNDFHMAGPVLHASGSGTVDIGNRTIDFQIVPATTASGRSVLSRITRTGFPKDGASSWIPPESVSSR